MALGDWAFTYIHISGDDSDDHGDALIDQYKVHDPNSKVVITKGSLEDSFVRDYKLKVNNTYTVHDKIYVENPVSLEQVIKFTGPYRELAWLTINYKYYGDRFWATLSWNGSHKEEKIEWSTDSSDTPLSV